LIVNRVKTGTEAFNVEYTLKQLKCKNRELTSEEMETISNMPPIDDLVPRQNPDEQKEFINKMFFASENTETDEESVNDVDGLKILVVPLFRKIRGLFLWRKNEQTFIFC